MEPAAQQQEFLLEFFEKVPTFAERLQKKFARMNFTFIVLAT